MLIILISAFVFSLLISLILTGLVKKLAPTLGLVDHPGGRKTHSHPIPQGGGVAIFLASSIIILLISALATVYPHWAWAFQVPDHITTQIEMAAERLPLLLYITGGGIAIALLGLLEDISPLSPFLKLISQIAVISVTVLCSGIRITLFVPFPWFQILVTVIWITLLVNSFNLLDNMDGWSGTTALVCGFALLVCTMSTGQYFIAGLLLCLSGALLGFLFFNFPPASIFMGDSGSMYTGYMLATASILTTFIEDPGANSLKPVLVPLIIFALPLYDTLSVILIRLIQKRPVFVGDTSHFSHRLLRAGMPEKHVLLTVSFITIASSLGAVSAYVTGVWLLIIPSIQALCIMLALMQLELWSR